MEVSKVQVQVGSICYTVLDQFCNRASENIIRKKAKDIQKAKGMKEKNHGHSGQLARTGKKCLQ